MMAASLRRCLKSLGATGSEKIEYIETFYGKDDYLDNVCRAIGDNLVYDKSRTESQPDSCTGIQDMYPYMYPSLCNQGWLGRDCFNGCSRPNYAGFYCKGMY